MFLNQNLIILFLFLFNDLRTKIFLILILKIVMTLKTVDPSQIPCLFGRPVRGLYYEVLDTDRKLFFDCSRCAVLQLLSITGSFII